MDDLQGLSAKAAPRLLKGAAEETLLRAPA